MKYTVSVDGEIFEVEVDRRGRTWVNHDPYEVDLRHVGGNGSTEALGEYSLLVDNRSYDIHVAGKEEGERWVTVGGRPYHTRLHLGDGVRGNGRTGMTTPGCETEPGHTSHVEMRAPLPGLLVELSVSEGEQVTEQQVVAVLESMKMNLELRAPRDGVVRDLRAEPGQQVAQDEVLAVLGLNGAPCSS